MELPKFVLHYYKSKPIDFPSLECNHTETDNEIEYNPFRLTSIQNYNPLYSVLFDLTAANYNRIHLNNVYQFVDMDTIEHQETNRQQKQAVFIKYSPLIDPSRYMSGKYEPYKDHLHVLPAIPTPDTIFYKIDCPNNSAYTDAFFNFLSSTLLHTHRIKNGIDYYGSYLGIQDKFKVNITDDLEYLSSSTFFRENINRLFQISHINTDFQQNICSRTNKKRLNIANTPKHNITVVSISGDLNDAGAEEADIKSLVYENTGKDGDNSNVSIHDESQCDSDEDSRTEDNCDDDDYEDMQNHDSDSNSSHSDSDADDHDHDQSIEDDADDDVVDNNDVSDTSSDTEEPQVYAYINRFPVQLICQEKCQGTIDELFEQENMGCDESLAAMFQIIMTLICYQKAFRFTHNDLHTNNIMYVQTDSKYLFYQYENKIYKVPTFGRIFKIIDFGRSIYHYREQTFCSDSFAPNGDAHTQYNCEPYLFHDKPRLDPNYSFDLCRLGCSIFDFIMDIDDDVRDLDAFQRTILRWCMDDNNKNILYKKNGDERYPHFKLYKMIARNVHGHIPREQLAYPEFSQYALSKTAVSKLSKDVEIMNIDTIPCYA